jgi:tetratricopeptide (TPR) repeat protein
MCCKPGRSCYHSETVHLPMLEGFAIIGVRRTLYFMTRAACWFEIVSIAVLAAMLGSLSVHAQSRQGRLQIPTQMSGKVLMEDGTPPPEPVPVEMVCGGGAGVPIAITDSKGGFVVRQASDTNIMDARQGSSTMNRPGSGSAAPSVIPAGCSVRARLVGFESSSITVVNSTTIDLGTITLRRIAGVEGSMTSATTLKAPKNARKAFDKARKAMEKQKWDQARPQLENATKIYPQYAAAWLELGRVYQVSGDLAQAKHACEQSIAADPKFVPPYLQLGTIFNQERKWRELADVTATAIKLNPYVPAAYVLNAMSNFRLGDLKGAEASAREAIKLDGGQTYPEAEYTLGITLGSQGDYNGAVEHLRRYLELVPNSPGADAVKKQLTEFEQLTKAAPPSAAAAPR